MSLVNLQTIIVFVLVLESINELKLQGDVLEKAYGKI